jgi:nitrogen fixation protein NifU and related proteins
VPRNEKALSHFRDPHNVGYINAPDGVGQVGNPACGDVLTMFIQVERDRLVDIKYVAQGCGTLVATCSAVSDLARNMTLEEARGVSGDDIAGELGGLPPDDFHCAKLAAMVLARAIEDCRRRRRVDLHDWRSMYRNEA